MCGTMRRKDREIKEEWEFQQALLDRIYVLRLTMVLQGALESRRAQKDGSAETSPQEDAGTGIETCSLASSGDVV